MNFLRKRSQIILTGAVHGRKMHVAGLLGLRFLKETDWLTVTSAVPQDSWLGPLFFIVYINDLPGVISKESSIALYADDSKMYRVISTQEDLSTFQSDIDKISDWCKMNKMRINSKKWKIMRITRKKSPLVGEYNNEP